MAERVDLDDDLPAQGSSLRFHGCGNRDGKNGGGRSSHGGDYHHSSQNHCQDHHLDHRPWTPSPCCFGQPGFGKKTNQKGGSSFYNNKSTTNRHDFNKSHIVMKIDNLPCPKGRRMSCTLLESVSVVRRVAT